MKQLASMRSLSLPPPVVTVISAVVSLYRCPPRYVRFTSAADCASSLQSMGITERICRLLTTCGDSGPLLRYFHGDGRHVRRDKLRTVFPTVLSIPAVIYLFVPLPSSRGIFGTFSLQGVKVVHGSNCEDWESGTCLYANCTNATEMW